MFWAGLELQTLRTVDQCFDHSTKLHWVKSLQFLGSEVHILPGTCMRMSNIFIEIQIYY